MSRSKRCFAAGLGCCGTNETGVYFRRFEPVRKTGPDAMEKTGGYCFMEM